MIELPLFLEIGKGALKHLPEILKRNKVSFKKPLVLCDDTTYDIAGREVHKVLKGAEGMRVLNSSTEFVEASRAIIKSRSIDIVFGVGGGKVIDVGKYASGLEDVSFVSIPTAPSNDGIASPVAVIDGKSIGTKMPIGLIADLDIISKAPLRNIRAGVGDLLANLSAVEDWRLARDEKGEKFDDFTALLSESAALLVLESEKPDLQSYQFLKKLVYGLVLSGIAMYLAGSSRPCSGGEHEISHAIDELYGGKALHGEQVALGTIFTLHLQNNMYSKIVKNFFSQCGLDSGWITREEFVKAIHYAPNTRKERYTILESLNMGEREISEALKKVM